MVDHLYFFFTQLIHVLLHSISAGLGLVVQTGTVNSLGIEAERYKVKTGLESEVKASLEDSLVRPCLEIEKGKKAKKTVQWEYICVECQRPWAQSPAPKN